MEKRKIGILSSKMEGYNDKIESQRRKMGGINASRDADRAIQKQIKTMENRLEKTYIKHNEV